MSRPGERLRRFASRWCSTTTMERLVDPIISDLQREYAEAMQRGHVWRGRWVQGIGYIALFKAAVLYTAEPSTRVIHELTAADRRVLRRSSRLGLATVTILTLAPVMVFYDTLSRAAHEDRLTLVLYLLPATLPVAIPIGIIAGILSSSGSGRFSSRLTAIGCALVLLCLVASFVTVNWIAPQTNQAFRVGVVGREIPKGTNELTLGELAKRIRISDFASIDPRVRRDLAISYHSRWGLALSPLAFALFALSATTRRPVVRWTISLAACGAFFLYYVSYPAFRESLAPIVIGWLPNVIALTSAVLLRARPLPHFQLRGRRV